MEIDGLAYEVLWEALNKGVMPNVNKMLDDGSHKLMSWVTDLSS